MRGAPPEIHRVEDAEALAAEAAQVFVRAGREALAKRGAFHVALAGGRTPAGCYRLLASPELSSELDWSRCSFVFGDERMVPPSDPASNYRMAHEALLSSIPSRVLRIEGELSNADEAARRYEAVLRGLGGGQPLVLDLALLGMGADGHTASLFPGSESLGVVDRDVAGVLNAPDGRARVSLTRPALCRAREVVFLVAGADKAAALSAVLQGPAALDRYPAQLWRDVVGGVRFIADRGALAEIE